MIAYFPDTFTKDFATTSEESVIEAIRSGEYRQSVEYLRSLSAKEYDAEKKKMPCVTWSGTFTPGTRSIQTLQHYTQLVVIDVDHLDPSSIPMLKTQLSEDVYVRYCFVSPSGTGLKIIIKVNTDKDKHRHAFAHLQKYLEEKFLIRVDKSGKDVSRLCYVSWDEQPIINQQSETFQVDTIYGDVMTEHHISVEQRKEIHNAINIFQVCVKMVERNKTYRDGEKNIYIHALACAMNRFGVPKSVAQNLIDEHYITPDRKWIQSVHSAYFHYMHEHGSMELRHAGQVGTFHAPPYISDYSDNMAINDLYIKMGLMVTHKIPLGDVKDLTQKLVMYYNQCGYTNMNTSPAAIQMMLDNVNRVMRENMLKASEQLSLKYETPEEMAKEIVSLDLTGGISMFIPKIDEVTGGFFVGHFYELIGFGETFKSVLALHFAFNNALNDMPVLVLNGEMSKMQFLDRLCIKALGYSLKYAIKKGYLTAETVESFISDHLLPKTKNNLFIFNGIDFSQENILATIDSIYAKTGKKIKMVVMDGLSQMAQMGRDEAPANIHNSKICKEIAKAANNGEGVAMIALVHCSGKENKLLRNTGTVVRGGTKMIANADGYFSTSLFLDPDQMSEENPDDIYFKEGKFCLRFADKRGGSGVHYVVMNVLDNLELEAENTDYKQYEVKV